MGYETQLEFVDVQMKKKTFASFCRFVEAHRASEYSEEVPFSYMFRYLRVQLDCGYLDWNLDRRARRLLTEFRGEPLAQMSEVDWSSVKQIFLEMRDEKNSEYVWGKWRHSFAFADWLCGYACGGRILEYSLENDGQVWGLEFNRRGQIRELKLTPVTGWRPPR